MTEPMNVVGTLAEVAPTFGLTALQRDVLLLVQEWTALYGVSPTYAEICSELGMGGRAVPHRAVSCLIERGHLAKLPHKARSLVVRKPIPFPEEPEIELTPAGAHAAASERR